MWSDGKRDNEREQESLAEVVIVLHISDSENELTFASIVSRDFLHCATFEEVGNPTVSLGRCLGCFDYLLNLKVSSPIIYTSFF